MTIATIFGAMLVLAGLILLGLYLIVRSGDKGHKTPVAHRNFLGQ